MLKKRKGKFDRHHFDLLLRNIIIIMNDILADRSLCFNGIKRCAWRESTCFHFFRNILTETHTRLARTYHHICIFSFLCPILSVFYRELHIGYAIAFSLIGFCPFTQRTRFEIMYTETETETDIEIWNLCCLTSKRSKLFGLVCLFIFTPKIEISLAV